MDAALNIVLAILCALVAIPLLMQILPRTIYRRKLDANGNPIGAAEAAALDEVYEEVMSVRSGDPLAPQGEGWRRDESGRELHHYLSVLLGGAMMLGAVCLLFSPALAEALRRLDAASPPPVVYAGRDLPRLARTLCNGSFHWANFIVAGIAALAITAGLRLY